jgi:cytochrome P450 family 135
MASAGETSQAAEPRASTAPATAVNGSSPSEPENRAVDPTREIYSIRPAPGVSGRLPPGPRTPAMMHMFGFWYRRHPFLSHCRERYGSRFTIRLRIPPVPVVVLSDPDDLKELFLAPPDVVYAGDGSVQLEKYFGPTGLTFMEEDEHLARRKLINRTTHGEGMKRLAVSMADVIDREVASWPRDEVIELYPRVHRLAVELMRTVSFGPQEDERLDELLDVHVDTLRFADRFISLTPIHALPPRALRVVTGIRPLGFQRFFELRERADRLIREVVEDRRTAGADGGADLVSVLLSATHEDGSPLSWRELRDEIVTTLIAGAESSAATISFALERLAHEPRVRERLVAEIDAGEDDSYLTATVQEILRLKPIVPMIPRLVVKPIEIGGVHYPPGVRLWGSAYLVHTDPSLYPDPYAFRPERFLEEGPGNYTWIPFGGGRRRCLGKAIAEPENKSVLRDVLTRYELRPASRRLEPTRSRGAALVPRHGLRMTLSDRRRQPAPAARRAPSTATA